MKNTTQINGRNYEWDSSKGHDISIALSSKPDTASAWYVAPVKIEPVRTEQFIGSVKEGGSVNFNNITFNPHGNGTHTECVGHISNEFYSINKCLKEFFFSCQLVSVTLRKDGDDRIITRPQIEELLKEKEACKALVIRTMPNDNAKTKRQYSDTNPAYLEAAVVELLKERGIDHLLIDLPSVDRELDGGILAAHHAFWEYPENPNLKRTITEFIYADSNIPDGFYLLNLQIASLENDASPSKPILYPLVKV